MPSHPTPSPRRGGGSGSERVALWAALLLSALAFPARASDTAPPHAAIHVSADPLDVEIGKALFERPWVTAPSRTRANDGLGPLYVARSCVSCHPGAGQGRMPPAQGMVVRLADDPVYGKQLQTSAVAGLAAEGRLTLREASRIVTFPDGDTVTLRRLDPVIDELGFGPITAAASARLAPSLWGLGALSKVSDAERERVAAEQAAGDEGVSGRVSPGRYGWKADQPTLADQAAAAFHLDIGMSSTRHREHWGDCTETQSACRAAPHGDSPEFDGVEIGDTILTALETYLHATPTPRPIEAPSPEGEALFAATGCATCHSPRLNTEDGGSVAARTDTLIHDMGPDLADGVAGVTAGGAEWRTAPLWGLSTRVKQPEETALLHDGRARSVEEAILWHGGEATTARNRYMALPRDTRRRLAAFVGTL